MKPNDHQDRESLSALYDGELTGEARLFALRRLAHDGGWKDECGRWQLIGDALRRQAPIAAPVGLAERVRAAVDAEPSIARPAPPLTTVAAPVRRPLRLWVGGALAASLAFVAVIATRGPGPAPAPSVPPAVAATPDGAVDAGSPSIPSAAPNDLPVATPARVTAVPVTAAARVELASTAPARPAVQRTTRRLEPARGGAEAAPAVAVAAFTPPDASNPFHVPANDPLAARPWPRAALGSAGTLTASYDVRLDNAGDSPSFYPFEPRPTGEATGQAVAP